MHTRMPAFGLANLGPLAEALAAVDKVAAVPDIQFKDPTSKVKAVGRHLVGGNALSCFKCHTSMAKKRKACRVLT